MVRTRLLAIALFATAPPAFAADDKPAEPVTFEQHVRPVFKKHCVTCHNQDRARGDLDLSSYDAALSGSASGKPVVPGKPDESPVYTLAAHLEDPHMPPNAPKIPQRDLDTIRKWIAGGLVEKPGAARKAADAGATTNATKPPVPAAATGLADVTPLARPTAVTALAVSPTAPLAAAAGWRQVLLYDTAAGKLLGGLPFPEGEVHALRFSRDGKLLLAGGGVGGASGKVVAFEVPSGRRAFEVGDEADVVLAVDLSADGSKVALGGPGRVVKVFSVPDGKQLHAFRKPTDWVLAVGFSPEGLLVAAGDRFGGLYVWETKSGKEFWTLRGHTKAITAVGWRADSNALASASEDGTLRVWDMHTGGESAKWEAHAGGVLALDFHPGGSIATAGRDGRVKVWDVTGKLVADLGPASDHVLKVGLTSDAKSAVAGDWSGELRVWPVDGGSAAKLVLPIDPAAAARVVVKPAAPPQQVKPATADPRLDQLRADLAAARQEAERATAEAEDARKALAAAKTAVEHLSRLAETRAAAERQAAERARRLQAELDRIAGGSPTAAVGDPDAKRAALRASVAALAKLRAAAEQAPANAALARAVTETERAVKELTAEVERTANASAPGRQTDRP